MIISMFCVMCACSRVPEIEIEDIHWDKDSLIFLELETLCVYICMCFLQAIKVSEVSSSVLDEMV